MNIHPSEQEIYDQIDQAAENDGKYNGMTYEDGVKDALEWVLEFQMKNQWRNNMTIRTETMSDFFTKFHIDGLPFDAVIHKFSAPDLGEPHDHPFSFTAFILKGGYVEAVYDNGEREIISREPGTSFRVPYTRIHKLIALPRGESWSLILPEIKMQESGFFRFENGCVYKRQWNEGNYKLIT